MPLIDVSDLEVFERLPGWRGRFFHSAHMTFAHYDFDQGALIHEHFHSEEEVYEVIEGKLEIAVAGAIHLVEPGRVAIVPADVPHSVKALTDGRVIIVDYPARRELG
jgi:quercetin dioxygenase-like cupin family protein